MEYESKLREKLEALVLAYVKERPDEVVKDLTNALVAKDLFASQGEAESLAGAVYLNLRSSDPRLAFGKLEVISGSPIRLDVHIGFELQECEYEVILYIEALAPVKLHSYPATVSEPRTKSAVVPRVFPTKHSTTTQRRQ